jgi:hypothetical protein
MELLTVFAWVVVIACAFVSMMIVVRSYRGDDLVSDGPQSARTSTLRWTAPNAHARDLVTCIETFSALPGSLPILLWALHHPEASVREASVRGLSALRHDDGKALVALRWVAGNDSNVRVRRVAEEALDEQGEQAA